MNGGNLGSAEETRNGTARPVRYRDRERDCDYRKLAGRAAGKILGARPAADRSIASAACRRRFGHRGGAFTVAMTRIQW